MADYFETIFDRDLIDSGRFCSKINEDSRISGDKSKSIHGKEITMSISY
jgi:hypothetical protein